MPAWYFVVGTAVHEYIQSLEFTDGKVRDVSSPAQEVEDLFMAEVLKQREIEPDTGKWLHGGTKEDPVIEERALKLAQICAENAITWLQDFTVWNVEYDATGHLPGCSMKIKAFLDAVGEHKKHGPLIIDWKTGKNKPKDNDQLETYHCLYYDRDHEYKGLYVMLNPGAAKARPIKFKETRESLGKKYGEVEQMILKKIAKPEPQFNCKFCNMKPNCVTQSGPTPRARYYDTPTKDGWFPF